MISVPEPMAFAPRRSTPASVTLAPAVMVARPEPLAPISRMPFVPVLFTTVVASETLNVPLCPPSNPTPIPWAFTCAPEAVIIAAPDAD